MDGGEWRQYLRGIGVGLVIAWVTSVLAYLRAGENMFVKIILFEVILSAIFLSISYALAGGNRSGSSTAPLHS